MERSLPAFPFSLHARSLAAPERTHGFGMTPELYWRLRVRSLRNPFFAIQPPGVLQREYDHHQSHARKSDRAANIEQSVLPAPQMHSRPPKKGEISDSEQNAQFRRPETPE